MVVLIFFCGFFSGFAEKLAELSDLVRPARIDVDGNELYVVQGAEILVFSLKDYRFQRKFGRLGQGPGELMLHPERGILIEIGREYVFLNSFNKMICFTKKGTLIEEKALPFYLLQLVPWGDNYAITKYAPAKNRGRMIYVYLFDADFNEIKLVHSSERSSPQQTGRIGIPPQHLFVRCYEGKLFILDKVTSYRIDVYDINGKPLEAIDLNLEKMEVTDEYKKDVRQWFRTQPHLRAVSGIDQMIDFPHYLPEVRNFFVDAAKIYVQTYRRNNELSEFVILDFKGRVLDRIFLPGGFNEAVQVDPDSTYTIKDGIYYYLLENEDTEIWELHRESIGNFIH